MEQKIKSARIVCVFCGIFYAGVSNGPHGCCLNKNILGDARL
jgi:hypothetical protein